MAGERDDVDIDLYQRLVTHGVEDELAKQIAVQMHQHTCNGCPHFATEISAVDHPRVVYGAQPALQVLALCRLFPVLSHTGYVMRQTPHRCALYGVDSVLEEITALRARVAALEAAGAARLPAALPAPTAEGESDSGAEPG